MQIEQSVMEMNGSPPKVFTPGWIDGAHVVGPRDGYPYGRTLSITRGGVASRERIIAR